MTRLSYKSLLIIVVFLLIPIVFLLRLSQKPHQKVLAEWWNDAWSYRQAINISSHNVGETNVYIITSVNIGSTAKSQADNGDFRFTDQNGQLLDYYISANAGTTAPTFHINFDSFVAGPQTIYAYYGNPSANNGFNAADFATQASNYVIGSPVTEETGGGPVAWWKFDEGVGTSVFDSSGHNNTGVFGTGSSSPSWVVDSQCVSGKCLYFDGAGDKITVANNATLNFGTGPFTATAWVKTNYTDTGGILDKGGGAFATTPPGWALSYATSPQTLYAIIANGTVTRQYNTTLGTISNWKQIGVMRDISNKMYYISDGQTIDSGFTVSGDVGNTAPLTIGFNQSFNHSVKGFIDDIKIYPYARTAAQIKQDYATGISGQSSSNGSSVQIGSQSVKSLSDGLVGYWKFDEGVGTSSADSSGNSNTATFGSGSSAPTWTTGKYGIGMSFNGSQYISVGNTLTTNQSFSISAWAKPTTAISNDAIIAGVAGYHIGLLGYGGKVCAQHFSDTPSITRIDVCEPTFNQNEWHHYIVTFNSSTNNLSLYKDGISVGTSSVATPRGHQNFFIGGMNSPGYFFTGLLDEVRAFNRALSPTEVKALYNYAPGPVGYWKFDEGVGTTAYDSSGNGLNGVLGTGSSSPSWVTSKLGKGLNFQTTTQNVTIADSPILKPKTLTLEAWVNPNSYVDWGSIIMKSTNNSWGDGYGLAHYGSGNNNVYFFVNAYNTGGTASTVVTPNTWTHVAGTYDGSVVKIYNNGVLTSSMNYTTPLSNSNNPLVIGQGTGNGAYRWIGQIDNVKVYDYARTQSQILEDMGSAPTSKSPILWYKFDEGQGSVANNSGIGGTLNGTLSNTTWTTGKLNKALSFNGTTSYVDLGTSAANYTDNFSVTAWVKTGTKNTRILARREASTQYDMYVQSTTGKIGFYFGTSEFAGTTNVADNQWHFLSWIINGTNSQLYVDGRNEATFTSAITTQNVSTLIGAYNKTGLSAVMNGLIDDVKIFNYALSSDEVKQEYNQGAALVVGASTQTIGATTTSLDYCIPGDTSYCANPVAEWKFDEGVGTTTFDTSGNGNNAVLAPGSSAPTWTYGKVGKALQFDGTNDYTSLGSPSQLANISTKTITFWTKLIGQTGVDNQGTHFINKDDKWFIATQPSSNRNIFGQNFSGTSGRWSFPLLSTGVWHFVAVVYNSGSTANDPLIYVDNQPQIVTEYNTPVGSASDDSTTSLCLGCSLANGRWLNGFIDQVRIYNYARTPAQIAYDYNQGGPIGWWKLDECQGSVAYDSSGIGNTGSINIGTSGTQNTLGTCSVGTSAAWTAGATGKLNSSLNFDGTDDYVNLGDNDIFTFNKDFSVTLWMYPKTGGVNFFWGGVSKAGTAGNREWEIGFDPSQSDAIRFLIGDTNGAWTTDLIRGAGLSRNSWHHVVGIVANGQAYIYIDGKQSGASTAYASSLKNTASPVYIGNVSNYETQSSFNGQLDDVRVYNYALTATQVKNLYNGGALNFR